MAVVNMAHFELDAPVGVPDSVALPDSITPITGTYADNYWLFRIKNRTLDFDDPTVRYPGFIAFIIKAYQWFDRTFDTYDHTYVKGDGRLGRIYISSDNWVDAYSFKPNGTPPIRMLSSMYANLGIRARYSILSIGYSVDMNSILSRRASQHRKWDFSLTTATFNVEVHTWINDGKTNVRQFGTYNDGNLIKEPFDGLTFRATQVMGYYIWNHKRFSIGSALNFTNKQRISQGSALLGLEYSNYKVDFDFTKLSKRLQDYYEYPIDFYRFHYQSYRIIGGYSYNWVANRHIVCNITALPAVGVTESDFDSSYGGHTLVALGGKAMAAISYSNKRFFAGLSAALTGNTFLTRDIHFYSVIQNYQIAIGLKF